MLTSFCNLLGTNDCSALPSGKTPVLWPLLTSCRSLLLRIFFLASARPPRVLTRSFPLYLPHLPQMIPCSYWALFCAANSPSFTALYAISVRQARVLPIRGTFQPLKSGFLQIPPHDGHPCLWLNLPATGRLRDFHPTERALTGRTAKTTGFS